MAYAHRQFKLDIVQYMCGTFSTRHAEYILQVLVSADASMAMKYPHLTLPCKYM